MVEYHEELEIDLLPDVDLLDLWRGKLSFRRLALLIRHLPATSALVRSIEPDVAAAAEWGSVNYQLADLFDAFARINFDKPKPYPRPADAIKKRRDDEARYEALQQQQARMAERHDTR